MKDKKQKIFDSTLALVMDHGFHGTSMSMIAKKASVAAGTIYHYFDSKEALLCQLYDNVIDLTIEACERANHPELEYRERFMLLWSEMLHFHLDRPGVLRFYEQFINSPFYFDNPRNNEILNTLKEFFKEGIAHGLIKPQNCEVLSILMIGNVITASKMRIYKKTPLTDEDLQEMALILWNGMTQCADLAAVS